VSLPDGLKENDPLPVPIITPTTKAHVGHDEDISREDILKKKIVNEEDYLILENYALTLFKKGSELAARRGLILVDTKYEFGKHNGRIFLIDEVHTPDSSRYFYQSGYEKRQSAGEPQKQLSKEFVRQWLIENGFQGKDGQQVPEMTDAIVVSIADRYRELYEQMTGEKLATLSSKSISERIEQSIVNYLN
jgi:phosphoribosylaminoimidazole-succinocarboxamide synthase